MTVRAVHQFVASFRPRDAIGIHSLEVRRLLREAGLDSEIYAWDAPEGRRYGIADYRRFGAAGRQSDTVLLYQLSTGGVIGDFVIGRPEPKIVNYHNITPAPFLTPWRKEFGKELAEGRAQLSALAPLTELGIAVSRYNETELIEAGYRATAVAPVLVDVAKLADRADRETVSRLRSETQDGPAWLFVGRLVPNKCQEDLIKAFAASCAVHARRGRLRLVGAPADGSYERALHQLAAALGVTELVDFAGSVSPEDLAAHYEAADVFVCLSEHEGFCVPLVEAMARGLPVIAYAASAVPETVGSGGIVLSSKRPLSVASAVDRIWSDGGLRRALSEAGRARAEEYALPAARTRFMEALRPVLEAA